MYAARTQAVNAMRNYDWTGEKFLGGFGETKLYEMDYWTLRERSNQLYTENIYAAGIVERLVTNMVSTGLMPAAKPYERILGVPEGSLSDWSDRVDELFELWATNPRLVDHAGREQYGEKQATAYREALIGGDILCVLHVDPVTGLPQIQHISGGAVQGAGDPAQIPTGNEVKQGVELDKRGRHVAYWVRDDDGKETRIPARGEKTGRLMAWLYYGSRKRMAEVRGMTLLAIHIQSTKEIDRYRDATQRKAGLNATVAMVVEKDQERIGSRSMTGGAVKRTEVQTTDTDGTPRQFKLNQYMPGMVMEELQYGEKLKPFSTQGTDVNFAQFEASIVSAIAWSEEIPPEILKLSYSSNYSASQAAINEFKLTQHKVRTRNSNEYCRPLYEDWFTGMVLVGKIPADTYMAALTDPTQWDVKGAWLATEWSGSVKPSTDIVKTVNAFTMMVEQGFMTRSRATRELNGTKFSDNVRQLARENEMLAGASPQPVVEPPAQETDDTQETEARVMELIEGVQ
jgi:lambda family phage portal protein